MLGSPSPPGERLARRFPRALRVPVRLRRRRGEACRGRVRVADMLSALREFVEGFPQGTVLGPVFWDFFLDDIVPALRAGLPPGVRMEIALYADDITVVLHATDRAALYAAAQSILDRAGERQRTWALKDGDAGQRRIDLLHLRFAEGLPVREIARRWDDDATRLHEELREVRLHDLGRGGPVPRPAHGRSRAVRVPITGYESSTSVGNNLSS